jgi:hypothetical protein
MWDNRGLLKTELSLDKIKILVFGFFFQLQLCVVEVGKSSERIIQMNPMRFFEKK